MVSIFSVKLEANSSADREGFQSFTKNGELTFFCGGWKSRLEKEVRTGGGAQGPASCQLYDLLKQHLAPWVRRNRSFARR